MRLFSCMCSQSLQWSPPPSSAPRYKSKSLDLGVKCGEGDGWFEYISDLSRRTGGLK